MRALVLSLLGLLWAALPAWSYGDGVQPIEKILAHVTGQGGKHHEIVYKNGVFTPSKVEVAPGDRVIFINRSGDSVWPASNIHPTHEIHPGFDPKQGLEPGQAWAFGFTRSGHWKFHNHLNPAQGGTVVVKGIEQLAPLRVEIDPETLVFAPLAQPLDAPTVQQLLEDDDALTKAVKTHGPAPVIHEISRYAFANSVRCHQRAHLLGRIAYELFGAAAFALSGHECKSGSYHGATEALFRERGTSNLAADVATICKITPNTFFRHQCTHGIGHGLMAWTNYELREALGFCDHLDSGKRGRNDARSCYSGVFMENVVGALSGEMGHHTKDLSRDDPHYPCNILDKKYVGTCYFYQTSHMIELFRGDFRNLAVACAESPGHAQHLCFRSMGRDVGATSKWHPEMVLKYCGYVSDEMNRALCISGAAKDWFWEASGAAPAISLCRLASEPTAKALCYIGIIERARNIFKTPAEVASFCAAVEPSFQLPVEYGGCAALARQASDKPRDRKPLRD